MLRRRERRTEESLAWLRNRLRAEVDRHRPDSGRIWARVEAAMNEQTAVPDPDPAVRRRPPRRRYGLRAATTTLATAGVLGATSLAVVMWNDGAEPDPITTPPSRPHRTGGPLLPSPAATVSPSPGASVEVDGRAVESVRPPAPKEPDRTAGGPRPAPVSVTAAHGKAALPHRGRHVLTLTVRRPLTTLQVTVRVARSRRTFPAGSWTSLPGSHVRSGTDLTADAIVYRHTLLPGRTLPPGEYVIVARYRSGGPHDPARDTFAVTARAAGADGSATIRGRF